MPSTHRGRLQSVDDPTLDLAAALTFEQHQVHIKSDGQTFGHWPLDDFKAQRDEENRFNLVIGGEAWTFTADDPADFVVSSVDIMARPSGSPLRRLLRRLARAGITVGAFSLAVATTVTAFAGGVLVGRYRIDDNLGVVAGAVVVIVLLSLIRASASRKLTPPPSVAARGLDRRPARVSRSASSSQAARATRSGVTLPGALPTGPGERSPLPGLTSVQPISRPGEPPIETAAHNGGEEPEAIPLQVDIPMVEPTSEETKAPGPTDTEHAEQAMGHEIAFASDADQSEEPTGAEPIDTETGIAQMNDIDLDITTIKGIGPALADRLNDLGVQDINDLANLDRDDTTLVIEYLGRFGKRLVADDWVGQARRRIGVD